MASTSWSATCSTRATIRARSGPGWTTSPCGAGPSRCPCNGGATLNSSRTTWARLPRLAEAAATLGLARTHTWVLPETVHRPARASDHDAYHAEVVRWHVERLGAIARVLDGFGIRLGLEVIGVSSSRTGRGLPFVCRLADLDRVLGSIQDESSNVGILLDGWHLHAAGEAIEAGLGWGIEAVVGLHIADLPAAANPDRAAMNDGDRGLPGENGAIDNTSLLKRLFEAGYDGPVTAEPMPGCRSLAGLDPKTVVRRVATAMRSVWPVGDPLIFSDDG